MGRKEKNRENHKEFRMKIRRQEILEHGEDAEKVELLTKMLEESREKQDHFRLALEAMQRSPLMARLKEADRKAAWLERRVDELRSGGRGGKMVPENLARHMDEDDYAVWEDLLARLRLRERVGESDELL